MDLSQSTTLLLESGGKTWFYGDVHVYISHPGRLDVKPNRRTQNRNSTYLMYNHVLLLPLYQQIYIEGKRSYGRYYLGMTSGRSHVYTG